MSDISSSEHPTILVIENEVLVQRTIGRLLRRKFGVTAQFVSTGEEAIKILEGRSDWKLVISDWNLDTAMDGGQILIWVMNQAPDLINRYVFLSSSDWAEKAAAGSGIPFIKKPTGIDAICETLRPFLQ